MTVYLVGAGPGDPGLLTVRGKELLERADVVVYDRLSVAALLDLAPPHAERINVGKAPGTGPTQRSINDTLVHHGRRHAGTGGTVVRLKGGDPFVFARGGEEAMALQEAGLDFEVVPGITSAIAAPAYAGIPVTLRHSSTSFTVVTGHEDPSADDPGTIDWEAAARLGGTIVVLMGVARIGRIAERLLAGGMPPDTPAAAVTWGTRPEQVTTRATLATIADQPVRSPAVYVLGAVAAQDLRWFEDRPLFGRRIVVTRTRAQASQLSNALRELGAEPIEVPTIRIDDPAAPLDEPLGRLADGAYDWVAFTSPNGVERALRHVDDARRVRARIAAIGPGTADALRRHRLVADLVPERFVAEGLLEVFPDGPGRVLLLRAAVARDVLPEGLRAKGWEVDVAEAYRTVPADVDPASLEAAAAADAITFTSSSTVERWLDLVGPDPAATPPVVACIGPVTAATASERGLHVDVVAGEHTIAGLVAALRAHLTP